MINNSFIGENPQLMLWVKYKPYPFWPAKAVSVNGDAIEIDFFGEDSSAIVEPKNCFLYSREYPSTNKSKKYRAQLTKSIKEGDLYIRNVIAKFGAFNYAEKRSTFNPANIDQHLCDMISLTPPMSHQNNTTTNSVQKLVHAESDERRSPKQKRASNRSKKTTNKRENNSTDQQVNRNKRMKINHQADEDETNLQKSNNGAEQILAEDLIDLEESRNDDINDEAQVLGTNTIVTIQGEEDCAIQTIQAPNKSNMFGMCSSTADSINRNSIPSTLNSNHSYPDGCSSAMNAVLFPNIDLQICSLRNQIDTLKTTNAETNALFCNEVKEIEREIQLMKETQTKKKIERTRSCNELRIMQRCPNCRDAKCCPNIRYWQNPCQNMNCNHYMETCQQNNPIVVKIED